MMPIQWLLLLLVVAVSADPAASPVQTVAQVPATQREYDGMKEQEIRRNDAYRRANPFFEQCIERADRLSGEFGVGEHCGNVAAMTSCTKACRRSFESYFRTLTTGCWVEIIVGLDKLHPDVAAHWKLFGEKIDTLCYHPPAPVVKPRHKKAVPPPPPVPEPTEAPTPEPTEAPTPEPTEAPDPVAIPEPDDEPITPQEEEEDEEEDEKEETVTPTGDVIVKDDFHFPQRFSDGMGGEFPDRLVPAAYVEPNNIADKLPWRRQHLVGRIGRKFDKDTVADLTPEPKDKPDDVDHIGPQDRIISYDAEREKGWLPGLDNA